MKILKWLVLSLFLSPVSAWALFGNNGGPDYSSNAGSSFYCASTGTVTTQAGVSASSPTLSISNPQTSGKNLVMLDVGITPTASPAAAVVFSLAYSSYTAPIVGGLAVVPTPAMIGQSTGTAKGVCTLQGVLPTLPSAFRYVGGTTGASAIGGAVFTDSTQGKVVLKPGWTVSLQTSSAAALLAHMHWREDPQ